MAAVLLDTTVLIDLLRVVQQRSNGFVHCGRPVTRFTRAP
jgi:hypothetical protein